MEIWLNHAEACVHIVEGKIPLQSQPITSERTTDLKALRAPKPIYERLKLPLLIIAYVVASELASPLPFRKTLPAQVAFVLLTVLLIRELHHLRLETSESYFGIQTRFGRWVKSHTDKVSKQAWLRFQRVTTWGVGLYAMGVMVNSLSTACNNPPQCVVRTPGMVLGNLPMLFQFIVLMFVMIAQLGVMFYAMVKVGSYKIVMPGTIGVSFDDVWGQDQAKQKVLEQVQLLDDSAHIEKAGGYMPKGLMLYGPPGCISGDAMVEVNRAGKSFKVKMSELVTLFVDGKISGRSGRGWDRSIPTKVRTRHPDGTIRLAIIVDAWESGEKMVYEVETESGRKVRASAEHPFLTEGGWKSISELAPGARVFVDGGRVSAGRGKKSLYRETQGLIGHPQALRRLHRGRPRWSVPTHRIVFEAAENGLDFVTYVARLRANETDGLRFLDPSIVVHHKDENTLNNDLSNLEAKPSQSDHAREHGENGAWRHVTSVTTLDTIVNITEAGVEATYDIEVESPNNYLANGFVVHNTGKTYLAKAAASYSTKPLILVPPGAFQAPQPLDTPVLTPSGWSTMGALREGDMVVGVDGNPVEVVGVYRRGEDDVYEVTFSDGAKTKVTADHLWEVTSSNVGSDQRSVCVHTHQLRYGSTGRDAVPLVTVQFAEASLPIPPYTLGALLGDGCLTQGTPGIGVRDKQIIEEMECEGVQLQRSERDGIHQAYLGPGQIGPKKNPYVAALEELGLRGTRAKTKFVPGKYLLSSVKQRKALLAGLLDTDGSINTSEQEEFDDMNHRRGSGGPKSKITYTSSSEELAHDMVHLVRSLGGTATLRRHIKKSGEPHFYVSLQLSFNPFQLKRKAELWAPPRRLSRRVVSVLPAGRADVGCILVDDPRHLYVTEDFITTRNTFIGINLLKVWALFRSVRKLSRRYGGVIVFIDEIDSLGNRGSSVEGSEEDNARKMVVGGMGGANQMGTLEAFLSAMDGMEEPRGLLNRLLVFLGFKPLKPYDYKYLMMGATNRLNALDAALLRAGRFGRKIHVDFPTQEGRHKTYEGYLSKISHTLTPENVEWAARIHSRGTGAEIKDIVNEAVLITYRDDRQDEGTVTFDDLLHAMVWVKFGESEGPFKRDEAKDLVAVHEAGHAVAFALLLKDRQDIWFASIEQRAGAGGMVVPTQVHEDWIKTKEESFAELQVDLASRVAEQLIFGTTTNGHGGDGRNMTKRAEAMVAYGMGDTIGIYKQDKKQVEKILRQALEATEKLLTPKKKQIRAVADLLIEKGTITGEEIYSIVEGKS